jgi:hypothetical protein
MEGIFMGFDNGKGEKWFAPVHSVSLPRNRPCTGRHAIFRPPGENKFPNFEDNILIGRRLGEPFQVLLSVFAPFDEAPLELWDDVDMPQRLVVYHGFFIAYSVDGGKTFQKPGERQQEIVGYAPHGRWSEFKICEVQLSGDHLLIKTYSTEEEKRAVYGLVRRKLYETSDSEKSLDKRCTRHITRWRLPLNQREDPIKMGVDAVEHSVAISGDVVSDACELLKTDGTRLFVRSRLGETFTPVPLLKLLNTLTGSEVDFWGGAGSRSFF